MNKFLKEKTKELIKDSLQCPYCYKNFNSLLGLMTHIGQTKKCLEQNLERIKTSLNENEFVECKICGEILARLDKHIIFRHNMDVQTYKSVYGGEVLCQTLVDSTSMTLEIERAKLWETQSFRDLHSSEEIGSKISKSLKNFFILNPHRCEEMSKRCIEKYSKIKSKHFKTGEYISTKSNDCYWYQSGFELKMMRFLDEESRVVSWNKNSTESLVYFSPFTAKNKRYIYDFVVNFDNGDVVIIETKQYPDKNVLFKLYSLDKYCVENSFRWAYLNKETGFSLMVDKVYETDYRRCDVWF